MKQRGILKQRKHIQVKKAYWIKGSILKQREHIKIRYLFVWLLIILSVCLSLSFLICQSFELLWTICPCCIYIIILHCYVQCSDQKTKLKQYFMLKINLQRENLSCPRCSCSYCCSPFTICFSWNLPYEYICCRGETNN